MQAILFLIIILISLCIGSFLNVIIYRLPLMLQQTWRKQCQEFLKLPAETEGKNLNLAFPRSYCPHCQQQISFKYNVPVLSYIFLGGKCANCHQRISLQYPVVEILSAIVAVIVVAYFGLTGVAVAALLLSWSLLVLIVIDLQHQLLPDEITLSLIWLGLIFNSFYLFVPPSSAILGAASAYLFLWIVGWLFKKIRKIEGIGYGDYKLFAVFGAWLGWQVLPFILFFAAITGVIVGIIWLMAKRLHHQTPLPFGPYLAIAGWLALFFGQAWINGYLRFIG